MWLFARDGFYSVVQKPEDRAKGLVSVRARRRDDLDRLADRLNDYGKPRPEVIKTFNADYPYRIVIEKALMAALAFDLVMEIDYPNFKSTQTDRHSVMMDIWSAARKLERPPFLRDSGFGKVREEYVPETRIGFVETPRSDVLASQQARAARAAAGICGSWVYTGRQGHPFRCALDYGHMARGEPHRSKTWIKKHAQRTLPLDGI